MRQLIVERSQRYLNARVIQPVNCTALLRTLAASEARLIELKDERDGETDLVIRRTIAAHDCGTCHHPWRASLVP